MKKLLPIILAIFLSLSSLHVWAEDGRGEKSYESWTTVAEYITKILDESIEAYEAGEATRAKDLVNEAYFGHYEVDGFEKTVLAAVSGKRVSLVEAYFHKAKKLTHDAASKEDFRACVEELQKMILEDGATLDAMRSGSEKKAAEGDTDEEQAEADSQKSETQGADQQGQIRWTTFITSLMLVLREGLEAILIVVAILAYLDKSKQTRYVKPVYWGALLGVVFSMAMAWAFSLFKDATSAQISREIFEGLGFFLAAIVLFFISNWMLNKSEVESWNLYIQGQVEKSLSRGSVLTLAFTSFLAVSREGAELILFFQGIAGRSTYDDRFMWIGIGVGAVILAVLWILIRVFSVMLPLKPFFYATSTLMFALAIVFVGKGVFELQEADWIGRTYIFGTDFDLFQIDWLGIYDRYESLMPQLILLVLALGMFIWNLKRNQQTRAQLEAELNRASQQTAECK